MKRLFFIFLLFLVGVGGNAQNYEWAFNAGGGGFFDDVGNDIATDASGNVYVCGFFVDTADFDPSANTVNLISDGLGDMFIAKYDASRNYLWAFDVGSTGWAVAQSIVIDPAGSGDIFVTGLFNDTADFDPSGNTANLTANSSYDIFVARYDANGNYIWAFNVGGNFTDVGYSISADASANVYVTGYFGDTVDFDPSGNTANLTANGSAEIFVAKYDANGNYLWAFSVGGTTTDFGYGIAIDTAGSGDVYVTGSFEGIVDFDPSGNTANLTFNGNRDMFVAKYDANGNYLWAFNVGGTDDDDGRSIAIDPAGSGDIYITGYFNGTADFDPSGNTANLTSGWDDIFVAKYAATGNYLWAFNVGETADDIGYDIATDVFGNVYVTGTFYGTVDFDPSGNTANLTASGTAEDMFVAKYDATGNYLWAFNVEGTSFYYVTGYGIAIDTSGYVYVCGSFENTADFDPSANTANLTANGMSDIFVAKYNQWPVGIEQTAISKKQFTIYPNPTSGKFTVSGAAEIQVYDLFGSLLLRSNEEEVDMSAFSKGLYFVRVGEATSKLILQ